MKTTRRDFRTKGDPAKYKKALEGPIACNFSTKKTDNSETLNQNFN